MILWNYFSSFHFNVKYLEEGKNRRFINFNGSKYSAGLNLRFSEN